MNMRPGRLGRLLAIVIAANLVCWPSLRAGSAQAAPSVWRDRISGFALSGFDPVAYHTRSKPSPGKEGLEHRWGGAVWQFINTGNRDAFAAHPKIYAPRFAGYDALALSNGIIVKGNPIIWAIYKGRVYLFQDIENLTAWRGSREKITGLAQKKWTRLSGDIPGTSEW